MNKDFSDSFNPILIKELTQGMRTKSFTLVFLLTQLAMLFVTLYLVGAKGYSGSRQEATVFFWLAIAVPFLLLIPSFALESINSEVKIKTMEMLYLSRLSASRIVVGKFVSQLVQTLLLAVTILPYIIMRYFSGGINPTQEVIAFGLLLLSSLVLTALSVASSSFSVTYPKTQRARMAIVVVINIFALWMGVMTIAGFMFGHLSSLDIGMIDLLAILLMAPCVIYQILSLGISQVAPEAENNLVLKRLNVFLILAIYLAFRPFSEIFIMLMPMLFCFLLSAAEGIFMDDVDHNSTYRPVFKRKSIALMVAPNRYGSIIWTNFCLIIIILMSSLEIYADDVGAYSFNLLTAPAVAVLLFFITINFAKLRLMQVPMSFLAVGFLPIGLFCCMVFHEYIMDLSFSDDLTKISFIIFLNFFIPYGLSFFIAKLRKSHFKAKYFGISFVVIFFLGLGSLIVKDTMGIRIYKSVLLFPFELFPGLVDRRNAPLTGGAIVYFQALLVIFPIFFALIDSARVFGKKCDQFKEKEERKESLEA